RQQARRCHHRTPRRITASERNRVPSASYEKGAAWMPCRRCVHCTLMQLPHHNFGARRAVLAVATAIALNCALTGVVVAAILPGSSSQASASPSPSPSPTPCPSDPTGVLCQLTGGGPPPPGTASPTPQPTPGKQPPPPAPGGGGGAPPGGSSTPPPGAGGAAPTPVPGPSAAPAAMVAATFKNAPFLGQLL